MKRIIVLLLISVLIFNFSACKDIDSSLGDCKDVAPSGAWMDVYFSGDIKIILNGKRLDAYTMHYGIEEEYAVIPLTAFLQSIGAKYADSPLNTYETECYVLMGEHYVVYDDKHLFMLEDDYLALLDELDCAYSQLSQEDVCDRGLLPLCESKIYLNNVHGGAFLTDHITLMNALTESGIDITINYDYSKMILDVTLMPRDE